jgi:ABC-type antimicrobial peptide transport system permease subunit
MVLRDGGALAATGLVAGGVMSVAILGLLRSVTTETAEVPVPLPFVVAGILALAAATASLVPARRATRTSPVDVMRSE